MNTKLSAALVLLVLLAVGPLQPLLGCSSSPAISSTASTSGMGGGSATASGTGGDGASTSGTGGSATSGATGTTTGAGGAAPMMTPGGAPLPTGWTLKASDRFGTAPTQNIGTFALLHAKYYEGQSYNREPSGLVKIPNVVINGEQETYVHFEDTIVFAADHLTIQARGHQDGSISSGEIVSLHAQRSWCVEARYQIPSADKSWAAFWLYGDADGHDSSEVDVEQPVTPNQGVHDVSMHNHPSEGTVTILDNHFTTQYMNWNNAAFDASAAPHVYTACYDDAASLQTRYIDGVAIYSAVWKWNESLGGTGHGPDASTIVNLAVGGSWPGNTANPTTYKADLDVYSIEYYGP